MKRTITLMFVILTSIVWSQELAPSEKSCAKNHLLTVNSQWIYFQDQLTQEEVFFHNDTERIAYHLDNVCRLLKAQNTEHLFARQLENRKNTISILEGYAARKVFPTNHYHTERQPYFIDNYGVHCAVGYLVKETGFPEISKEIARTQNYAYVKEIKSKELLNWAKQYGFSVQELALIQPAYSPQSSMSTLGAETNGEVKDLYTSNQVPNDMVIAGNYTEIGEINCLNIGKYSQGNFSCFGSGLTGTIEGVEHYSIVAGDPFLRVYGDFEENGIHYPYAEFQQGTWELKAIAQRPNTTTDVMAGGKDYFMLGVSVVGEEHDYEVYEVDNDSVSLFAEVYGELYTINGVYSGVNPSFGGDFDSIHLINEDRTLHANNALFWYQDDYHTVTENIIDKVYDIVPHGTSVYLTGHAELNSPADLTKPLVTRYMFGTNQKLLDPNMITDPINNIPYSSHIYSVKVIGVSLYIFGDVQKPKGIYDGGSGVLRINLITGVSEFVLDLDSPVNDLVVFDNMLIIGGEFTQNTTGFPYDDVQLVQFLGAIREAYSNVDEAVKNTIKVYPNPAQENSIINIELPNTVKLSSVRIIDMKGRAIELEAKKQTTLPALSSGSYVLVIQTSDGNVLREKLIIQ